MKSIPKPIIIWAIVLWTIVLMILGFFKLVEILNFCLDHLSVVLEFIKNKNIQKLFEETL